MTVKTKAPSFTKQQAVDLWVAAKAAGEAAAAKVRPTPMVVGSPTTPLGSDIDPSKETYYVAGGVCGMGYVYVRPGNSSFARHMKAAGTMRTDSYYGGVMASVGPRGCQSYEINSAYAYAMAAVLTEAGVQAYVQTRVD